MTAAQALELTPSARIVVGVMRTRANDSIRLVFHAQEHGAASALSGWPIIFGTQTSACPSCSPNSMPPLETNLGLYGKPAATKTALIAQDIKRLGERVCTVCALQVVGDAAASVRVFAEMLPYEHVFGIGDKFARTKARLQLTGTVTAGEVVLSFLSLDEKRRLSVRVAYGNAHKAVS